MPIAVRCKCGHAMNVPDSAAGKVGKCPKCQQQIAFQVETHLPSHKQRAQKLPVRNQRRHLSLMPVWIKLFAEAGLGVKQGTILSKLRGACGS